MFLEPRYSMIRTDRVTKRYSTVVETGGRFAGSCVLQTLATDESGSTVTLIASRHSLIIDAGTIVLTGM